MRAHFHIDPTSCVRAVLVFAMSGSFSPCKILMKNHAIPSKIIVAFKVNKLFDQKILTLSCLKSVWCIVFQVVFSSKVI